MSTRDELADDMRRGFARPQSVDDVARWLIAEGWRKKPSRDDLIDVLHDDVNNIGELADSILALMDRGTNA